MKADALIAAINSGGMWFGGIDGVINRAAGNLFHLQATNARPLKDGKTVVAKSNGHAHDGAFANVVFVVDDLQRSLAEVVYAGLKAASDAGFKSVTVPTIRMGVMRGAVEKSLDEAAVGMGVGVRSFIKKNPGTSIQTITFVVYNDKKIQSLLEGHLLP
ncbi:MAG: macro domain-containing protein [bacterium]|nr:macro domain-containing protein [bacterium]